jgi:thiamine-phosphate pyrophosphorylase
MGVVSDDFGVFERIRTSHLYVLVDGRDDPAEFERLACALVRSRVDVLQLRDKRLADRQLLERARLLRQVTQGTTTLFVMNDRPDLALLAQADGVHVGQDELTVQDVRRIVGPDCLIGVSTHTLEQARQALVDGADYIGCGPTFPSGTKSFTKFAGLRFLTRVAAEIALPSFAIGGIGPDNLADVLETGIRRIAVSGSVLQSADPVQATERLLATMAAWIQE